MVRLRLLLAVLAVLVGPAGTAYAASTVNSLPAVPTFPFPDSGCAAGSTQNVWISQGSGGGNDYRATINQVDPLFIGATAPACPYRYELWANTSLTPPRVQMYTGASWVTIAALDTTNNLWVPPIGGGVSPVLNAATTTDLGSVPNPSITIQGTTTIASFGSTTPTGQYKYLKFNNIVTLTYNPSSLILPGAANVTTAVNDTLTALSLGGGNWMVTSYMRSSGAPLNPPSAALIVAGLGFTPLNPANNLSDVASIATSRANLIPSGTITAAMLQTGAVVGSLGYTPMNPANNLGDVASIPAARNILIPAGTITPAQLQAGAAVANLGYVPLNPANNLADVASIPAAHNNIIPAGSITPAQLQAGATVSNLGYVPLNRAANLSDVSDMAAAHTNLGLGSMAYQNANAVAITGGTVNGVSLTNTTITTVNMGGIWDASTGVLQNAVMAGVITPHGLDPYVLSQPRIGDIPESGSDEFLCINATSGVVSSAFDTCVPSDERLKTGWGEAPGLSAIMKLNPTSFDWLDAKLNTRRGRQIGLSAQEVRKVLPELVAVGGDMTIHPANGPEIVVHETMTLDYSKLVVPLIKAVQEQQQDIKQIKLHMQR